MKKLAVITGASRGLGLAIATEFIQNGWEVLGTGKSPQPAELPQGVGYQQFDASDAAACEAFWQQLQAQHGDVEICLINNAGGYAVGEFTQLQAQDYAQQMQTNFFSAVYMTRGLALHIPRARIINILSTSALVAKKQESAYGASKAAAKQFFQSLQKELTPERYRITNLYPYSIATHGPDPKATDPKDLANFVRIQAENTASYYLSDATIYPQ